MNTISSIIIGTSTACGRCRAVFAIIAISAIMLGCGRKSAEERILDAEDSVRAADWGAAAKSYKKAAAAKKDSPYVYINMAAAYIRDGDTLNARNAIESALAIDPGNNEAKELMADIAIKTGDFYKAHGILESALKRATTPEDRARVLNSMATAEFELHREDLAMLNVKLALMADPDYAPAHFNHAHLLSDYCQMYDEAIVSFEKFITLTNDEKQGAKAREAIEHLRPFAGKRISDATFNSKFSEAKTAYNNKKYDDTLSIITKYIIPKWPNEPKSYILASYSWAAQRRYYEARVYGIAYIGMASATTPAIDTSAFRKWLGQIPETPFSAGR